MGSGCNSKVVADTVIRVRMYSPESTEPPAPEQIADTVRETRAARIVYPASSESDRQSGGDATPTKPNRRKEPTMSKIYCTISQSARKTKPTARAHSVGTVKVQNWQWVVETTLHDRGGGDADWVYVVLKNINTGEERILSAGTCGQFKATI